MTTKFEQALLNEIKRVREDLQGCETLSSFRLLITASGRVHDGVVDVTFILSEGLYGRETEGGRLNPVVAEFKHRHGWAERNAPLCLSFAEGNAAETNAPVDLSNEVL